MEELVVNVVVPKRVAAQLQQSTPSGVAIESIREDAEQTSRFGLIEAVTIIGLVKGVEEVIKLALEIRRLLRQSGQGTGTAQISTPGSASHAEVDASLSEREIEQRVRGYFSG